MHAHEGPKFQSVLKHSMQYRKVDRRTGIFWTPSVRMSYFERWTCWVSNAPRYRDHSATRPMNFGRKTMPCSVHARTILTVYSDNASSNPLFQDEALEEVHRCLGEGMIGLGELYTHAKISAPVFYPIIEKCIEQQASILVHVRGDLSLLRPNHPETTPFTTTSTHDLVEVSKRYPEAILIHGHLGGGGDWEHMVKALVDAPAIFLDTLAEVVPTRA